MSDNTAYELSERLGFLLLNGNLKIATAESCTGGGLSEIITRIPGSSQWFDRGFVTYSNESKQEMLNVAEDILDSFGAVSEQTALAMAQSALSNSAADIAVSITGIAGPDGGTKDKPVGTVCLAWAQKQSETKSTRVLFNGNRDDVRSQSSLMALQGCIDLLERNET